MTPETRKLAIRAAQKENPFIRAMEQYGALHPPTLRLPNIKLVNRDPAYVRRLVWYPYYFEQPREALHTVEITGLQAMQYPGLLFETLNNMVRVVCHSGMNNLRIERWSEMDRDVTIARIVIDSRGWTG